MGCHTWWYRKVQDWEFKEIVNAGIKYFKKNCDEWKKFYYGDVNLDDFDDQYKMDFIEDLILELSNDTITDYIKPEDIRIYSKLVEFMQNLISYDTLTISYEDPDDDTTEAKFYSGLLYNIIHYPLSLSKRELPFELLYDQFTKEWYIPLTLNNGSEDRHEFMSDEYKNKLLEYESLDPADYFESDTYDRWILDRDQLERVLDYGYCNINGSRDKALEFYDIIEEKFGACRIKFS